MLIELFAVGVESLRRYPVKAMPDDIIDRAIAHDRDSLEDRAYAACIGR